MECCINHGTVWCECEPENFNPNEIIDKSDIAIDCEVVNYFYPIE